MNVTTKNVSRRTGEGAVYLPQYSDPNRPLSGQVSQFLNEPIPFVFMMSCRPVVIKIVKDLNTTIHMVKEALSQKTGSAKEFDRLNGFGGKTKLMVS